MSSDVRRSASQYQQKMQLDADDEVAAVRLDGPQKGLGLAAQVAVKHDLAALVVEDADIHGPSMQIDPAVASMLASVEAHGSPPGSDEWFALSSFLTFVRRSRRGLHHDQSVAASARCARFSEAWPCPVGWACAQGVGEQYQRWRVPLAGQKGDVPSVSAERGSAG
jgi:hypothetical protein